MDNKTNGVQSVSNRGQESVGQVSEDGRTTAKDNIKDEFRGNNKQAKIII